MEYSSILHFLNGSGDYASGVALYKQYGNNSTLLSLFESGNSSYSRGMLRDELQKIYDLKAAQDKSPTIKAPATTELPKPESFSEVRESKYPKINPALLPEELKPTWKKIVSLLKEQGVLHSRLPVYQSDEERLTASLRILDIEDEFAPLWKDVMHWQKTGELPEVPKEKKSSEDPFALMDELNRMNVAITRAKKDKAAKSHIKKLEKERAAHKQKIADARKSFQTE